MRLGFLLRSLGPSAVRGSNVTEVLGADRPIAYSVLPRAGRREKVGDTQLLLTACSFPLWAGIVQRRFTVPRPILTLFAPKPQSFATRTVSDPLLPNMTIY